MYNSEPINASVLPKKREKCISNIAEFRGPQKLLEWCYSVDLNQNEVDVFNKKHGAKYFWVSK